LDPPMLGIKTFWSRICEDQTINSMIKIDRVLMIAQPLVAKQVPT